MPRRRMSSPSGPPSSAAGGWWPRPSGAIASMASVGTTGAWAGGPPPGRRGGGGRVRCPAEYVFERDAVDEAGPYGVGFGGCAGRVDEQPGFVLGEDAAAGAESSDDSRGVGGRRGHGPTTLPGGAGRPGVD